jgi:hypothetical protein
LLGVGGRFLALAQRKCFSSATPPEVLPAAAFLRQGRNHTMRKPLPPTPPPIGRIFFGGGQFEVAGTLKVQKGIRGDALELPDGRILVPVLFRALRQHRGAFIETHDPDQVRKLIGLLPDEPGIVQRN